jgi:hypothetical protein
LPTSSERSYGGGRPAIPNGSSRTRIKAVKPEAEPCFYHRSALSSVNELVVPGVQMAQPALVLTETHRMMATRTAATMRLTTATKVPSGAGSPALCGMWSNAWGQAFENTFRFGGSSLVWAGARSSPASSPSLAFGRLRLLRPRGKHIRRQIPIRPGQKRLGLDAERLDGEPVPRGRRELLRPSGNERDRGLSHRIAV